MVNFVSDDKPPRETADCFFCQGATEVGCDPPWSFVRCTECRARGPSSRHDDDAQRKWNAAARDFQIATRRLDRDEPGAPAMVTHLGFLLSVNVYRRLMEQWSLSMSGLGKCQCALYQRCPMCSRECLEGWLKNEAEEMEMGSAAAAFDEASK